MRNLLLLSIILAVLAFMWRAYAISYETKRVRSVTGTELQNTIKGTELQPAITIQQLNKYYEVD